MQDEESFNPILLKPIPPQIVHEGAAFGPLNLKKYFAPGPLTFVGGLKGGQSLPAGLICTEDGIISGIPANGTVGTYIFEIVVKGGNETLTTEFNFTIKSRAEFEDPFFLTNLKSEVWEMLGKNLPLPELTETINRPITAVEIYYLLQRFATLTIWDIYNLEPPGEKVLLTLPKNSPHYHIYDRGSCIVATPISLYSHERTLEDALQAARAAAGEVFKRGWTIEFAGFNKMIRAAWVEIQLLSAKNNKVLEILHYNPSPEELRIYEAQSKAPRPSI